MFDRTCRIYSERNLPVALVEMECAHLVESDAVEAGLYVVVASPAAETVPHFLYGRGNVMCGPVGISVVCHDAAEPLILFILIFNRRLHPVVAVEIECDSTLVEQRRTVECCLYGERKEPVGAFHL